MRGLTQPERDDAMKFLLSESAADDPWQRAAFLAYYEELTLPWRINAWQPQDDCMLTSDKQLRDLVAILRRNPGTTRKQLEHRIWPRLASSYHEQERLNNAVSTVVRLGFMLHCNAGGRRSKGYRIGPWTPSFWEDKNDQSFGDFVKLSLPRKDAGILEPQGGKIILSGANIVKRCGLKLVPTNHLDEHLLYDATNRRVYVFRFITWVEAQLERVWEQSQTTSTSVPNLKTRPEIIESIPRGQLMLEVLETFHKILFTQRHNDVSVNILNQLIDNDGFDCNAMNPNYRQFVPRTGVEYFYLGDRLEKLYELVQNPPAKFWPMTLIEDNLSDRLTMSVAVTALIFSIVFGLLSCVLSCFQLVLAYLAWQYPKSPPTG